MNALADTYAIMAETPNGFDELRIIAQDVPMSKMDKETLIRCADEWEGHQRDLIMAYAKLIESNEMRKAQTDLLREIKRTQQLQFPKIEGTFTAQWR